MIETGDVVGASHLKVAIGCSIWHSSPEALGCIVFELSIKLKIENTFHEY